MKTVMINILAILIIEKTKMIKHSWKPKIAKSSQRLNNKKLYDYGIENPVKKLNEVIEMELKAEKAIKLADGKYTGVITGVIFREPPDHPFAYTDIGIKDDKTKLELKCGMPSKITEDTTLGMFLENITGKPLEIGKDYVKVLEELEGQKVEFMVVNKKTDKGSFCNILSASVKPIK